MSWNGVPLSSAHDPRSFSCGAQEFDEYFRARAGQDKRRGFASVYLAESITGKKGAVCGYYTLPAAGVLLTNVPEELRARMPRYPSVPAVRLGRLAVSLDCRGRGLGEYMLVDAIRRSLAASVGWHLFIVDAKDNSAQRFYQHFGFASFSGAERSLYLRRKDIEGL